MCKGNERPSESRDETDPEISKNVIENKKYIKKLELQRLILNKLLDSGITPIADTTIPDPVTHDTDKPLINTKPL